MALDKDTASPTGIMNPADYLKEEPKKTKKQTEKERQAQEKDKEHTKQALERTEAIKQENQKQERVAQQRQDRIAKENAQEEKIKSELSGTVDDYMNKQEGLANAKRLNTTGVSGASHLAPKMSYNMGLSDPLSNKLKADAAANPKINLPSYIDGPIDFANIKDTPITFDANKALGTNAQDAPDQSNTEANPTGIANPANYLSRVGTEWNNKAYGRGDKFNKNAEVLKEAGKRTSKEQDQWGNALPDNAYDYVEQMLSMERAKGNVNKNTLKYIEHAAKVYYAMPKNWDISASGITMTNGQMSKVMNNMPYSGTTTAKQPEPAKQSVPTKQSEPAKPKPVTENKPKGTQVGNTNSAVANAKPGDFLVRSDGTTIILKQGDIDHAKGIAKKPVEPKPAETTQPTKPAEPKPAQPAQPTLLSKLDDKVGPALDKLSAPIFGTPEAKAEAIAKAKEKREKTGAERAERIATQTKQFDEASKARQKANQDKKAAKAAAQKAYNDTLAELQAGTK